MSPEQARGKAKRGATVSPDGRWLDESDESGQFEICVRSFPEVDSGRRQISTGGGTRPRWSRDGRELFCFVRAGSPGSVAGALMAVTVERGSNFAFGRAEMLFQGNYPSPNTSPFAGCSG